MVCCGIVAEWSKALVSGTSLRGASSNLADSIFSFNSSFIWRFGNVRQGIQDRFDSIWMPAAFFSCWKDWMNG